MTVHDYFLTGEEFYITGCQKCNLRFTNPKPSESEIMRYYDSANYISHSDSTKGFIGQIYKRARGITILQKSLFVKRLVKQGKLLDIGCGTGDFLYHMQRRKFCVTGIEPNINARDSAVSKYQLDVRDEDSINNFERNYFDVITLWHVLEHVHFLNERLEQIHKILKSEGYLFVAVPNFNSKDCNHYGKYWAAYDVPRHLYHFNLSSLPEAVGRFGFKLINIKPLLFDAFYISLLSEKLKYGKQNYFFGFMQGFLSNLQGLTTKNYSSNLFVFKKEN